MDLKSLDQAITEYVRPANFLVVEGLLNFHTETLRSVHDVRVMLCPPEKLTRVQYKAKRDKLRAMVKEGLLSDADLQRYDAVLVGCLK